MKILKLEETDKTITEMVFDTDGDDPSISIKFHKNDFAYDCYEYKHIQTYKFRENGNQFENDMYTVLYLFTYDDIIQAITDEIPNFTTTQKYILYEFILRNIIITSCTEYDKLLRFTGFKSEISILDNFENSIIDIIENFNIRTEIDMWKVIMTRNINKIYFRNTLERLSTAIDWRAMTHIKKLFIEEFEDEENRDRLS